MEWGVRACAFSALAAAAALCFVWALAVKWRRRRLPPGPFPLPLLGNLLHLTGAVPHQKLARLAWERYGPVMHLQMGSMPAVVVSSGEAAREFLLTHDKAFASRPPLLVTERIQFGYENAFALGPYGPRWRESRKLTTVHLFNPRRIAAREGLRMEELRLLLRSIARAQPHEELDLTAAMTTMVENVVCRTLFRRRMSDVIVPAGYTSLEALARQVSALFQVPVYGDYIPCLGFLDRATKKSMDLFHAIFDAIWESLICDRERAPPQERGEDILDVLLSNYGCHRRAVKACLSDLLGAALDTSTAALDWTMAELLNHPPILKKLQAEIANVVGPDRLVEEADLPKLPYLKAIVKETLRLHTPAPLGLPHLSTEACEVMGYSLPKGTWLFVNMWAIGRDRSVWKDAEAFWPERFLLGDDDDEQLTIDVRGQHFDMIPFGSGRRSCPGMPFALPLLQLVVSNLAHCFDWQLPAGLGGGVVDMSETTSLVAYRKEPLLALPKARHDITLLL